MPVAGSGFPLAWLGLADGEVFVQPSPGATAICNGARLSASHWLRDGDVLRLGSTRCEVSVREGRLRLAVEQLADENPTEPPVVLVPPPRDERLPLAQDAGIAIRPIGYTPRPLPGTTPKPRARRAAPLLAIALLAVAAAIVALVSLVSAVGVVVDPAPETLALRGGPAVRVGARWLALRGAYVLVAEKPGYHPLEQPVTVTGEPGQVIRVSLRLLPGRVAVDTGGVAGAEVALDGRVVGRTPLAAFPAEPGDREIRVRAEGYQDFATRVAVAGGGREQRIAVALVPLPSPPPGQPRPPAPPPVLALRSEPGGARVSVDGQRRGETPLELRLEAGRAHAIRLSAPGHEDAELRLRVAAGVRREETVRLVPQLGEVRVVARPPDAELIVDGQPRGRADQTLRLAAVPHEIEARRDGYEPAKQTVTPRPGFPQTVELVLKGRQQAREERAPRVARSPEGHELRLVEGGRFKLGAPRRDPGRRANEALRDVELVRRFYVAAREVTNLQYRRFAPAHVSGRMGTESLDGDDQPVVRVSWQDAARYCNWLSEREGLPKAYVEKDGTLVAAAPLGTGYRLPTEAEWERVARYPGGSGSALRFPWGQALPVPRGAGNYADERARSFVAQVLEGLDDGYAVSAPVQSLSPNALGLFHLGGNVAEWAHDRYVITPSVEGQLVRDPLGPAEGESHVVRGASFLHGTVSELRLSYREQGREPRPDLGFRLARYADPEGEP